MDEELHELIRETVRAIPEGRVATYGDVAKLSRAPSARLVGQVLNQDGHDLPWHRVLKADGTCAPHIAEEQLQRLRSEGVVDGAGKVNLRTYRWEDAVDEPEPEPEPQGGLW
ncbi:MGMT family protein [Actinosynnema pretiosum subsp. pretiosum]|uniref:Methylated-DNA-(Protein)-cysteine S-methyltransferase DNA binding n=2 Tax=Actinosynnema TaxID=40566 RepID=C6WM80_ACTMD|nr:MGMT family protein [Actinosynnema mirum]ACU34814.1 Methylated-DNA-(protein)-cysteine S- methyltransferase DNA binding [Actinosynnema mirum DSM 43827]AXX28179.1 DNA-methyltransferase [Actinosynnema pretiosum subsp. pretiosum]QUF07447.1 MGMT family protein [Actinosynnema pretiosum subsp. pretiosum]